MSSIYETGEYLESHATWHAEDSPHKAKWIASILRDNGISPGSIAEIGCGSGEILVQLADYFPGAMLEGWDVSPQAHAIASPKSSKELSFHLGSWKPDRQTDLVMAIDVVEHVDDYRGFLREMQRTGGKKLFHIPLDLSVKSVLAVGSIMRTRAHDGHLHSFLKDTALATLEDCGFRVIDWRYTHGAELPNQPWATRLLYLPRRIGRMLDEDLTVRMLGGSSLLVLAE